MGKVATTIEEQISLLKERGMNIPNEIKAKEQLLDIGYYRLGFYWCPFEKKSKSNENDRHCLDSCIKVITFILRNISENRAYELEERLDKLLIKYSSKDLNIKEIIENKINYKF